MTVCSRCQEVDTHSVGCYWHQVVELQRDVSVLKARLKEGISVVEGVEKLPPERIGSREYGWMRDWLAAANATLSSLMSKP